MKSIYILLAIFGFTLSGLQARESSSHSRSHHSGYSHNHRPVVYKKYTKKAPRRYVKKYVRHRDHYHTYVVKKSPRRSYHHNHGHSSPRSSHYRR